MYFFTGCIDKNIYHWMEGNKSERRAAMRDHAVGVTNGRTNAGLWLFEGFYEFALSKIHMNIILICCFYIIAVLKMMRI